MQSGPSDENGTDRPARKVCDDVAGCTLKSGHRELLSRINQVNKVVRHFSPLRGSGRRCAYVHTPIDGHGVHGHQFGAPTLSSYFKGDCRFTRGCGPDNDQMPVGLQRSTRSNRDAAPVARCGGDID